MIPFTHDQYLAAYFRNRPARWIKLAFKYFSKETIQKDIKVSKTLSIILLALFGAGFISTVANFSRKVRGIITVTFFIILAPVVLFLFSAGLANNARIKRICKELGCTIEEYNRYVDTYLTTLENQDISIKK